MPEQEPARTIALCAVVAAVLVALEIAFTAYRDTWSDLGERLVIDLVAIAIVSAMFIIPKVRAARRR